MRSGKPSRRSSYGRESMRENSRDLDEVVGDSSSNYYYGKGYQTYDTDHMLRSLRL